MPPVSSSSSTGEKERLQRKFSAAATALADLYRESSNSYEAGYRDALLFVQRYLQSSSPAAAGAQSTPCTTVNAAQMTRFLQDTAAARRERMAVVRGVRSMRRRQRDPSDLLRDSAEALEEVDENRLAADRDESEDGGEAEEEEEPGLTPQSSPAMGPGPSATQTTEPPLPHPTADATLNQEMEVITHLEPRVAPMETPLQPHLRCRRSDRLHNAPRHPRMTSTHGHPLSPQLHVRHDK